MHCPSCRHPLESLIIEQRPTGVWQCLKCRGAWLYAPQLMPPAGSVSAGGAPRGLLSAGSSPDMSPGPRGSMGSSGGSWGGSAGLAETRVSPWQPLGGATSLPTPPPPKHPSGRHPAHSGVAGAPEDWDLCSWCGKSGPGMANNCRHCNIERLHCPLCAGMLVGARRMGVLVDVCQRCQGLWFEKGRLEALLEALRTGTPAGGRPTPTGEPPSLLQQLASFLEETEPSVYSERSREEVGIWDAFASSVRFGARGSRKVVYDFLTLLGDLTGPGGPRR